MGCPSSPATFSIQLPPLPSLEGSDCAPWPAEQRKDEASPTLSVAARERLRALADQWLQPLTTASADAWKRDVYDEKPPSDLETDVRGEPSCPRIVVRSSEIYLERAHQVNLTGCGRVPSGETLHEWKWGKRARLLVILRLLRLALRASPPEGATAWPDFAFRVCVDDECHACADDSKSLRIGRFGSDALHFTRPHTRQHRSTASMAIPMRPLFTMVACGRPGTAPTLPLVQWMPTGSAYAERGPGSAQNASEQKEWFSGGGARDEDLSQWDTVLVALRRARVSRIERWHCRAPMASWRGSIILGHGALNAHWSARGVLQRTHVNVSTWRTSSRFALMAAKCSTPSLFNVRAKVVGSAGVLSHREWLASGLADDEAFKRCRLLAEGPSRLSDEPKYASMDVQASHFQV